MFYMCNTIAVLMVSFLHVLILELLKPYVWYLYMCFTTVNILDYVIYVIPFM